MEMQGVLGSDRHPVEWKFQAGGGSKAKMPYVGRVRIFSGTTQCLVTTSVLTE